MKASLAKYSRVLWILGYTVAGAAAILFYVPAREHMIVQDAWVWIIKSNVTFNFILFFFLWGMLSDKMTKKLAKWKGWLVWGIGLIIIVLAFHFLGGYETIWS